MWQKGNYGLYVSPSSHIMYWPDNTGWSLEYSIKDIWLMNGEGWTAREKDYLGAALVAPLHTLFWEKE